jgi:hypothetical protein
MPVDASTARQTKRADSKSARRTASLLCGAGHPNRRLGKCPRPRRTARPFMAITPDFEAYYRRIPPDRPDRISSGRFAGSAANRPCIPSLEPVDMAGTVHFQWEITSQVGRIRSNDRCQSGKCGRCASDLRLYFPPIFQKCASLARRVPYNGSRAEMEISGAVAVDGQQRWIGIEHTRQGGE